jgi:hypothetical protein
MISSTLHHNTKVNDIKTVALEQILDIKTNKVDVNIKIGFRRKYAIQCQMLPLISN